MSEAALQGRVVRLARRLGWTVVHVGRAVVGDGRVVTPTIAGWPDLLLLNPDAPNGVRVMFLELKSQRGRPSDEQVEMMALLIACGIPGGIVTPEDWRTGKVRALLEGR